MLLEQLEFAYFDAINAIFVLFVLKEQLFDALGILGEDTQATEEIAIT